MKLYMQFLWPFLWYYLFVFNNLSHDFSSNILKHLKINGDIAYKIYTSLHIPIF